jgi:probable phosphoglycerate mutase
MSGLIYVMRHGQSVVNVENRLTCKQLDGDLTDMGRLQAAKAGSWLIDKDITRIVHSPFHRAEQTAQIIGAALGVTPTMNRGLCEMDCGDLEGRTDEEAWTTWRGVWTRWKKAEHGATFPGGESYGQAHERYSRVIHDTEPDEHTLLVTHGGITICVLPYLCVNAAALQGDLALDNTGLVVLERYDEIGRYICRSWNLTEHL